MRDADGNATTVHRATHGKGKRWRAMYVDDAGREHGKVFERKAAAQPWLDTEVTAKFATGSYVAPSAGKVTVAAVYAVWSAAQAHVLPETVASRRSSWRSRVEPQWGDMAVADVRTAAVRAWVAAMAAEGAGVPTMENAFGLLRQVLGAAVEDGGLARNPCQGVRLPKRQHADRGYLSHVHVAALAAAVDRQPEVIRFLAYTGLRWGEMAALRVCDFDMLRRRVNVSRPVTEAGALGMAPSAAPTSSALTTQGRRGAAEFQLPRPRLSVRRGDVPGGRAGTTGEGDRSQRHTEHPRVPDDHTARPEAHRSLARCVGGSQRQGSAADAGDAKASMTLDVYADLFDDDLDAVAANLDAAIESAAARLRHAGNS
ncbi:tyrosine-type recombinase/integrase [Mycobacterium kiyosense]|uniref:tyrosine-type recombinase/integrase n=1 Tax=Mycobacterium kiyosense TaxID=2871094 RepID=UPI00403907CA